MGTQRGDVVDQEEFAPDETHGRRRRSGKGIPNGTGNRSVLDGHQEFYPRETSNLEGAFSETQVLD